MLASLRSHVLHNAVGYVALFIALGGAAYAAGLPPNSVGSRQIKNGTIGRADMGAGTLTRAYGIHLAQADVTASTAPLIHYDLPRGQYVLMAKLTIQHFGPRSYTCQLGVGGGVADSAKVDYGGAEQIETVTLLLAYTSATPFTAAVTCPTGGPNDIAFDLRLIATRSPYVSAS
jgi:hypothetical protein